MPAAPSVAHIEKLRSNGLGWHSISELTGVGVWALRDMVQRNQRVRRDSEQKILAVRIPAALHTMAPDEALIDSTGTARRLQALTAIGYSGQRIADELGMLKSHACEHISGERRFVRVSTAKRVDDLFKRLHMVPGPDDYGGRRARLRAERKGWPPPLAWENIDDPAEIPDLGESLDGKTEFLLAWEDNQNLGRSDRATAESLGVTVEAMRKRLERLTA